MKWIYFIFLFFIAGPVLGQIKVTGTIKVIDRSTNSPKSNITVVIKESGGYFTTDINGTAKFSVPSAGFYTIRIVAGDKVEVRQKEISYDGQKINLFIGESDKGAIDVIGEAEKSKLSRYSFQQEEIRRIPGAQGDSLKALQTLPGIVAGVPLGNSSSVFSNIGPGSKPYSNSNRCDLVLRGADCKANQYYFDGFPVSYPFHLGNQSSVFNNSIIKSVDIYTGPYSARYGYATGGIINVEGKSEVKKNAGVVNLNFFLSDALAEIKLSDKAYMIAGARKSYPNVTLLKVYPDAIPPNAKYATYDDFQFKSGWEISPGHKVSVSTFGARDVQKYTKAVAQFENQNYGGTDMRPPIGLDREFRTDGFRYVYQPTPKFSNTFSFSKNYFREFYEVKFTNPTTAETIFGLQNVTTQNIYYMENVANLQIIKDILRIQGGGTYRERTITLKAENITQNNTQFSDTFNNLLNSSPVFRALIDGDGIRSREVGGFLEMNLDYKGFKFVPGVRSDYYNLSGQKILSPRLQSSYTFDSTKTTFQGGGGIHYNAPNGLEQISERVGNKNLRMEKAEKMAGGINQELGADWLIKLEGFHNIFSDIVTPDNNVMNPYAANNEPRDILQKTDSVLRNPIVSKSLNYSNSGTGFSKGVEIFLKKTKKPGESGWFGWISYTNSISKRNNHQARYTSDESRIRNAQNAGRKLLAQTKVGPNYLNYYDDNQVELVYDNDNEELYDYDRTHLVNLVFGWKINPDWQIGGRFRYATNVPYTPITSSSQLGAASTFGLNLYVPNYSTNYNSDRLSSTHQLDVRFDRFYNYEWGYINVYLELINLYGRRNPTGQDFSNTKPYVNGSNPALSYDTTNSPYIQSPVTGGHLLYLPYINFGIEARF